jgi:hypothetical protein
MIIRRSARIDLYFAFQSFLKDLLFQNCRAERRPADVSKANEKNPDLFHRAQNYTGDVKAASVQPVVKKNRES